MITAQTYTEKNVVRWAAYHLQHRPPTQRAGIPRVLRAAQ
jgi:hypothetical protein